MKQTSTQPNIMQDEGITDTLYHAYYREYMQRGVAYFAQRHSVSLTLGQRYREDFLKSFMLRLTLNPSLFTVLTKVDPYLALTDILYADDSEDERSFIIDMLDDITVNVKIRCGALYDECHATLMQHLDSILDTQTNMSAEQREIFNKAFNFAKPYLVTLHYLRKIGYQHEINNYIKQEEYPS